MDKIPFGVSRFDSMIGGGAPPGSTVLLSSEVGAGGREFLYTCAVMNGLARRDEELFDLYYGDLHEDSVLPESVQYLSFTSSPSSVIREMDFTMASEVVSPGTEAIGFEDLSAQYFGQSHVPTDWYLERTHDITSLGEQQRKSELFEAIGEFLTRSATGSLVLIDSITDLISTADEDMDWDDITMLIKGLKKASHRWGGLVLLLVSLDTLTEEDLGRLMEATDGSIIFEWEAGGTERARTMYVKQFRGVLSRLEEEDIIRFETEIHDGGFDISDVRKIR